jgi:peptide/nickel transport system substrate-binding protein
MSGKWHSLVPAVARLGLTLLLSGCTAGVPAAGGQTPAPAPPTPAAQQAAAPTPPSTTAAPTAAAQPAAAKGGGTLVYAMPFEVKTFDPHRENEETATIVVGNVYDTLVQLDPADPTKAVPRLATQWTSGNNNTQYTLTLRPDAVFSNGDPVTADDVKFSLDRLWNLQASPSFILEGTRSVDVLDPQHVRIVLEKPDAAFIPKLAFTMVAIVDSKVAKQNGALSDKSAAEKDTAEDFFNKNSIGSGAFVLASYTPDSDVVLKRNPRYWGDGPFVDQLIIKSVPESTTQRQLLEKGDIDIAANIDFKTAEDLQRGAEGVKTQFVPSINTIYMFLTNNPQVSEPISHREVRQAIQRSLDYDGLLALAGGHGRRPPTTIPLGLLGADSVQPINQNLDEAKKLLAQAGYANGFQVDVQYPDTTRYNLSWTALMTKIQADLARVGITLNLQPVQSGIFLDAYRAGKLPLGASFWSPDYVDPDDYVGPFWSSQVNFLPKRFGPYKNEQIDTLVQESLAETDRQKRIDIYRRLQELFLQDANLFTLLQPDSVLAYRDRADGYQLLFELREVDFSKIRLKG